MDNSVLLIVNSCEQCCSLIFVENVVFHICQFSHSIGLCILIS